MPNRNAIISTKKSHSSINSNDFSVVAIGASAGGLTALNTLFDNIPINTGMAFVVIQHLDPNHKSLLPELIARHTKMKVSEITNGIKVQPNNVFVIPANKELLFHNYTLKLAKVSTVRSKRRPIDFFMSSLAKNIGTKAIGVILSGTGTEGAKGFEQIKLNGGLTIVQNPSTAEFVGMPENVIKSGFADYILSLDKIPDKLIKKNKQHFDLNIKSNSPLVVSSEHQKQILDIIKNQTGQDFSNYKSTTITRRLIKHITLKKLKSVEDYIQLLLTNTSEVVDLYHEFLIGVTAFFRDLEMFRYFENKILPDIVSRSSKKNDIRIWICGCSTGEEAYSFAILLKEFLQKENLKLKVTIFASDLSKDAIAFARKGIYSAHSIQSISNTRLSQFFVKNEVTYQIKKEIREMIVFANHNVINDPPFSKIDFISCRNLLIYFDADLQRKIIQNFHYSLVPEGVLILGPSESLGASANFFFPLKEKFRIFMKKNTTPIKSNVGFELDFVKQLHEPAIALPSTKKSIKSSVKNNTDKMLKDQYVPPSVILNKFNEIQYFSGNTSMYLVPPAGIAQFDILGMVTNSLKPILEETIKKARKKNDEVVSKNITILNADELRTVKLKVKPLLTKDYESGTLLVVFEAVEKKEKTLHSNKNETTDKEKQKRNLLEKELKITSQHLQIAISELELSREDFNCSTEELQSSNEELETSREELQSVNEELITVNAELSGKINLLSDSNNDLSNLLKSTEIATLYLNKDLLIKRFTPAAAKIFNLIPTDIDRSIQQLSYNLIYTNLIDDIKHVIKTLVKKSIEVQTKESTWFLLRIIPFRTIQHNIEGVLITLVDITAQKKVQFDLEKSNDYLSLLMENLPVIPFTVLMEPALAFSFVGKTAEKVTGFSAKKYIEKFSFWSNRIHVDDKKQTLAFFKKNTTKKCINHLFKWKCADGKFKQFLLYMKCIPQLDGRPAHIIGAWQEVQ